MENEISVLVSPSGSEIVIPIIEKTDQCLALVGADTAKVYASAKLRLDSTDLSGLQVRILKLSQWSEIVGWFCLDNNQAVQTMEASVGWLIGVADLLRSKGWVTEDLVSVADITEVIQGENDGQQ